MGEVQWIKIYIDMFDKRKIKKLRRLPAGNELLLIWIMLLATAGKCNAGGMIYITETVPFTEEDLADELGFEVGTVKLALTAFRELDMIATTDDGFISVVAALCAVRICHTVREYLIPSHASYEIGYRIAIDELGLVPLFDLGMRLGEGSGCPIAMMMLDAACAVMNDMATFAEADINDDYLNDIRKTDAFTVKGD